MHSSVTSGALGTGARSARGNQNGRGRKAPTVARAALTSAATFDWGSSLDLQRFAVEALGPARLGKAPIDLDAATSSYWHRWWQATCRSWHFFDGASSARDALREEAWRALAGKIGGMIGSVFCNPPGLENGGVVKQFWAMIDHLHTTRLIDSACWVGFNLDQARALISDPLRNKTWLKHPLGPSVVTVFPGRRVPYLAHPAHMITILEKRLAARTCKGSERERIARRLGELVNRASDQPVPGPSPTHASYVTVLLSHSADVARTQRARIAAFLESERENETSVFRSSAAIGVGL